MPRKRKEGIARALQLLDEEKKSLTNKEKIRIIEAIIKAENMQGRERRLARTKLRNIGALKLKRRKKQQTAPVGPAIEPGRLEELLNRARGNKEETENKEENSVVV